MQKAMAFENKTGIKNPTLKSYESGITGTGLLRNLTDTAGWKSVRNAMRWKTFLFPKPGRRISRD